MRGQTFVFTITPALTPGIITTHFPPLQHITTHPSISTDNPHHKMSQDQEIEALHNINKRLLKDQTSNLPAITLADGTKIQTGTIGALIQNIKLYDRICAGEEIEGQYGHQLYRPRVSSNVLWSQVSRRINSNSS